MLNADVSQFHWNSASCFTFKLERNQKHILRRRERSGLDSNEIEQRQILQGIHV